MAEAINETRARVLAAVWVSIALAAAASLAPIQDETYYWTWARAPALAYVDHPPGVAWILALSTALLGDGVLGLRAPSIAAMITTAAFIAAAAARLAPERPRGTAWLALLLLAAAPMFTIGYLPATPDPFQGAAIAAAAYLVVRALEDGAKPIFAALAAFTLVAAALFKHSSGVLAIGVLAGALATARGRALLRHPAPWLGAFAGLLVLVPWLAADLAQPSSFTFQAERVLLRGERRGLLAVPVLIGGVAVALGPAGLLALLHLRRTGAAAVALGAGAAALITACLIPVWAGGGELNWSMPAFVLALPAAAAALAEGLHRGARTAKVTGVLAAVCALLLVAVQLHVIHPFLPLRADKDTTLRGAGFETLARAAADLAQRHGAAAIVTRRYQPASELRYHLRDAHAVVELGAKRRTQYDAWPRPVLCAGDVAVVVTNVAGLPPEIAWADDPQPEIFERRARGAVLDRWYLTAARVAQHAFDPDARCAHRVARGAAR